MKITKLLFLALLLISIRQVSGEKEADKKCDPGFYKCGDVCVHEASKATPASAATSP